MLRIKKLLILLIPLFLISNGIILTALEPSQKNLSTLKLPAHLGKIVSAHKTGSKYTVLFIQDAHNQVSAQASIRDLILYLEDHYSIRLIAAEGASTRLNADFLKSYPDQGQLEKVLQKYHQRGELSGLNQALIKTKKQNIYEGIEDASVFDQGLIHYENAVKNSAVIERHLRREQKQIERQKIRFYTEELKDWDRAVNKFSEGKINLQESLETFAKYLKPVSKFSTSTAQFQQQYDSYERAVFDHLLDKAPTSLQSKIQTLNSLSNTLPLLRRFAKLELSRQDWDRLSKEGLASNFKTIQPEEFIHHLAFYHNTLARDFTMSRKLLGKLQTYQTNAILVAGGFHEKGITDYLRQKNVSYLVIQPNLTDISEAADYKQQMLGKVSWNHPVRDQHNTPGLQRASFLQNIRNELLKERPDLAEEWQKQFLIQHTISNRYQMRQDLELLKLPVTNEKFIDLNKLSNLAYSSEKSLPLIEKNTRPADSISKALSFDKTTRSELRGNFTRNILASSLVFASTLLPNTSWGQSQDLKLEIRKPGADGQIPISIRIPPEMTPGRFVIQTSENLIEWNDFMDVELDESSQPREVPISLDSMNYANGVLIPPVNFVRVVRENNELPAIPNTPEVITPEKPRKSISLMNTGANLPPAITPITNQTVDEDQPLTLNFSISDPNTPIENLTVFARSTNTVLISNSGLVINGSGTERTLTLTPNLNASGQSEIMVRVSDGVYNRSSYFQYNVLPVNDAPTLSNFSNTNILANTSISIPFILRDIDSSIDSLSVSAVSSNPTLLDQNGIAFSGTGTNRTLILTPRTGQTGNSTITVSASDVIDTAFATFNLTVATQPSLPPSLASIAPQSMNEDTAKNVSLTISDPDTALSSLIFEIISSNPNLIDASGITFSGTGSTRTMTLRPKTNQFGISDIIVKLRDGYSEVTQTFRLTVNAVNDPPTISSLPNQSLLMGDMTPPLTVNISDPETPAGSLNLIAFSSNTTLVPNTNITLSGSNEVRTVTVKPVLKKTGTATISVRVSDGLINRTTTFILTVNSLTSPYVILEWDPNPANDYVTHYTVLSGNTSRGYTRSDIAGNVTRKTVTELPRGEEIYFAVTASNAFGTSGYSNEVSTNLPLSAMSLSFPGAKISTAVAKASIPKIRPKLEKGSQVLLRSQNSTRDKKAAIAAQRRWERKQFAALKAAHSLAGHIQAYPLASEIHYDFNSEQIRDIGPNLRQELREVAHTIRILFQTSSLETVRLTFPRNVKAQPLLASAINRGNPFHVLFGEKNTVTFTRKGLTTETRERARIEVTTDAGNQTGITLAANRFADRSELRLNVKGRSARLLLAAFLGLTQNSTDGLLLREQPTDQLTVFRIRRAEVLDTLMDFTLRILAHQQTSQSA